MNIFELAFVVGVVALVILVSIGLGYLSRINWLVFIVPVAASVFLVLRYLGGLAMGKQRNPWPFERKKPKD